MLTDVREQDLAVSFLSRIITGELTSPLLLVGPEGTGRRFAVRQMVRDLFCTGTKDASCVCIDCLQLKQDTHPDYKELAAGEKDIGIGAIRDVIEESSSYPSMAKYRIFLLDGADRMTSAAANAFLKTLEEPPRTTRFFLLAETAHTVLLTIRSRCGLVAFHPLSEGFVARALAPFEPDVTKALVLARMSEGSIGRALTYWASGRLALRDKALTLLRLAVEKDLVSLFLLVDEVTKEMPLFLRFLDHVLHDLLMTPVAPTRLINLDLRESVGTLASRVRGEVWQGLRREIQETRMVSQKVKINVPFHLKAILVQAFAG